jgi:predicted transcriptional regulator
MMRRIATCGFTGGVMSETVSIRLEPETTAALDRLAKQTGRSRSWLVRRAIEDFVSLGVWQLPKILKGIAAAEQGDFATTEEIARIGRKYSGEAT